MNDSDIQLYKQFRTLCNQNAEDALIAAGLLSNKGVNHIVFHLSVLALEEIGKIFILWHNLNAEETWDKDKLKIPLDDHIKKLFWAIWGPSFGKEKITKQSIDEIRGMASQLHNKRLDTLYINLIDANASAAKVSDKEASMIFGFAKTRLNLSRMEGEINENGKPSDLLIWFNKMTDIPERRLFIFGNTAQEKLVELGNSEEWFAWLKDHFEKQDKILNEIALHELNKKSSKNTEDRVPKWKVKFKIISQSHSIRNNVLSSFNKRFDFIQLFRGGDNHTLYIEATFDKSVLVSDLWQQGWMVSKLFVAALNVGTNGFFYWNTSVDLEKYYEEIRDLENNKKVSLTLQTKLTLGWHERKMALTEKELYLSKITFEYFLAPTKKSDIYFIDDYMTGLAMFAKTDIHLRLEGEIFYQFYLSFKHAVVKYEACEESQIKEIGYSQIERLLKDKPEYERILDIGATLGKGQPDISEPITLKEVVSMKQYCGAYLLTLAVRKYKGNNTLRLTLSEQELSES